MKKTIYLITFLSFAIYAEEVFLDHSRGKLPQDFSLFNTVHESNSVDNVLVKRDSIKNKFDRYDGSNQNYMSPEDLQKLVENSTTKQITSTQTFKDTKDMWQGSFIVALKKLWKKFFV